MGTTLTGTTPQDTYDSLIKVTDNGPLSGTLKTLTDGLGNDSALALSTGAASITGTLASTAGANFATSSGSVGIGTTSADAKLDVVVGSSGTVATFGIESLTTNPRLRIEVSEADNTVGFNPNYSGSTSPSIVFKTQEAERMRITSAGNVGIGTSTPSTKLTIDNSGTATTRAIDLVGNSSTAKGHLGYFADGVYLSSNYYFEGGQNNNTATLGQANIVVAAAAGGGSISFGTSAAGSTAPTQRVRIDGDGIKFNADTLAANALDDYEEGTWTMGVSFGGASVGVTTLNNTGTYTKIGRQVTVNGRLSLTSKGSSTGNAAITGLPFTQINSESYRTTPCLRFANISFANAFQGLAALGTTTINLEEITEAGADGNITNANFVNTSDIIISYTYFV